MFIRGWREILKRKNWKLQSQRLSQKRQERLSRDHGKLVNKGAARVGWEQESRPTFVGGRWWCPTESSRAVKCKRRRGKEQVSFNIILSENRSGKKKGQKNNYENVTKSPSAFGRDNSWIECEECFTAYYTSVFLSSGLEKLSSVLIPLVLP